MLNVIYAALVIRDLLFFLVFFLSRLRIPEKILSWQCYDLWNYKQSTVACIT